MVRTKDECIISHRKAQKKWKENHKKEWLEMIKKTQRTYSRKIRSDMIDILGGKCSHCSFKDFRALQVDHISGGGNKERKAKLIGITFYKHVKLSFLNKENKYQLLCANCNWIKRFNNKEAKGNYGY